MSGLDVPIDEYFYRLLMEPKVEIEALQDLLEKGAGVNYYLKYIYLNDKRICVTEELYAWDILFCKNFECRNKDYPMEQVLNLLINHGAIFYQNYDNAFSLLIQWPQAFEAYFRKHVYKYINANSDSFSSTMADLLVSKDTNKQWLYTLIKEYNYCSSIMYNILINILFMSFHGDTLDNLISLFEEYIGHDFFQYYHKHKESLTEHCSSNIKEKLIKHVDKYLQITQENIYKKISQFIILDLAKLVFDYL